MRHFDRICLLESFPCHLRKGLSLLDYAAPTLLILKKTLLVCCNCQLIANLKQGGKTSKIFHFCNVC